MACRSLAGAIQRAIQLAREFEERSHGAASLAKWRESLMELVWLPSLDRKILERTTEIHDEHFIDQALASGF